jgi:hypothetical protein
MGVFTFPIGFGGFDFGLEECAGEGGHGADVVFGWADEWRCAVRCHDGGGLGEEDVSEWAVVGALAFGARTDSCVDAE